MADHEYIKMSCGCLDDNGHICIICGEYKEDCEGTKELHNFEPQKHPGDVNLCKVCKTVRDNPQHIPLKNPFPGQTLRKVDQWSNMYEEYREEVIPGDIGKAQIVCSDMWVESDYEVESISSGRTFKPHYADADKHKPILDIDFPAKLLPSTTEGHFHLFLDKELTWNQYRALLSALAEAGILEEGYVNASIARKYSAARLPWVKKEKHLNPNNPDEESPF